MVTTPASGATFSGSDLPGSNGVNTAASRHACWADFNGDGFLDVYVGAGNECTTTGPHGFLWVNTDGTAAGFFNSISEPLVAPGFGKVEQAWADVDRDGDLDLVWAGCDATHSQQHLLFLNDGSGVFEDATDLLHVDQNDEYDYLAVRDFDTDGDIDLLYRVHGPNGDRMAMLSNQILESGLLDFVDVTDLTNFEIVGAPFPGDWNNDGLPDVLLINSSGVYLYRNLGGMAFEEVTAAAGLEGVAQGIPLWADLDNDLDLDLVLTRWYDVDQGYDQVFRNEGDGTFVEVPGTGLEGGSGDHTGRASCADYDNDGDLDVHIPQRDWNTDKFFENLGSFTFVEKANEVGLDWGADGVSSSWADIDNDLDMDLVLVNRWSSYDRLYVSDASQTSDNHSIEIILAGCLSNTDGIGAHVSVYAGDFAAMREIGPRGFGADMLRAHFGLGNATLLDSIVVQWPSGVRQVLTNVPADQILTIQEGPATVSLDLDNAYIYRNCALEPTAWIANVCDLGAFQFDLLFPPDQLEFVSAELGDFLGSTGRATAEVGPNVGDGWVSYGAYSYGDQPGPSGNGSLATLRFDRLATSTVDVNLNFQDLELVDTGADLIPGLASDATIHLLAYIFGDFNESCEVTVADIMQVASRWGAVLGDEQYDPTFDIDLVTPGDFCSSRPDGDIDIVDIQLVASQWATTCDDNLLPQDPNWWREEGSVRLLIDPESINGHVGEVVETHIVVSQASNIGGFETILSFDPQRVTIESITLGDFLGSTGNQASLLQRPVGDGAYAVGAFSFGPNDGPSGDGVLATIAIRILDCSGTELALQRARVVEKNGREVPTVEIQNGHVGCETTGVDEPIQTTWKPHSSPNPYRTQTLLRFAADTPGHSTVAIFDVSGRLVRELHHDILQPGNQVIAWDGRDRTGTPVPPGVYFAHLRFGNQETTMKLLRIE
jgi:hypothetical protein